MRARDRETSTSREDMLLSGPEGEGAAAEPEPDGAVLAEAFPASGTARAEWSPDLAVAELYSRHYRALVRLAALLVRDTPTAEEVVQDSFVAMHGGWQRLRDAEKALAYLRQAVVNRSRSVLRHRTVVDKNLQKAPPDMPSAEHGALVLLERDAVVAALRDLPDRQREAIVLRYYADLSEAEIAAAMRISRGAVKSHTARGMTALRAALEQR
jgi:RNA polymerase sigma-70 factor (sigma-E family)